MTADDLEAACGAVHDALPAGWTVGHPSHRIKAQMRPWRDYAIDLRKRAKEREYVEATGWTGAEAIRGLAALLRLWNVEPVERPAD